MYILNRIRHVLERDTVTEDPVSQGCRLALYIYRLGRGDYFYTIAEMAGLGVSTVCTIVDDVTQAIVNNLWSDRVNKHMPKTENDFWEIIIDMEYMWQFPCCWAAIDGCHIPIKCSPGGLQSCKEYRNFKNFYSVVSMALVDSNYRFIWDSFGFPWNSHDAIIFQSNELWSNIKDNDIIVLACMVLHWSRRYHTKSLGPHFWSCNKWQKS